MYQDFEKVNESRKLGEAKHVIGREKAKINLLLQLEV